MKYKGLISLTLLAVSTHVTAASSISASPNPCMVQSGETVCTSTITWSTDVPSSVVWVLNRNTNQESIFASNRVGSKAAPWIKPGPAYSFRLRSPSNTILASVEVTAESQSGQISANPNPCLLGGNGLCSSTINWNSNDPSTDVYVINHFTGSRTLFSGHPSGTIVAPWIKAAPGMTFELDANGVILDSINVFGISPSGQISANPNPCTLQSNGLCSSTISWTSNDATADVYVVNHLTGSRTLFSGLPNDTKIAPWIKAAPGMTFELDASGVILDSVNVFGVDQSNPPVTPATTAPIGLTTEVPPIFRWQPVNGATSYRIEVRDITSNSQVLDETVDGQASSFRPNLQFNIEHQYQWRIAAVNSAGSSAFSPYRNFSYGSFITLSTVNGTTDQVAISTILNTLNSYQNGGVLELEAGQFDVQSIEMRNFSNVIFRGTGTLSPNSLLVQRNCETKSGCTAAPIVLIRDSDHVSLENIAMESDGNVGGGSNSLGVWVRESDNIDLASLNIRNIYRMGVGIQNSHTVNLMDTTISENGFSDPEAVPSTWTFNSDFVTLTGNDFTGRGNGAGGDGSIDFHNSRDITLTDNTMRLAGASPFYIVNTKRVVIQNNTVLQCSTPNALDIVGATEDLTITDNFIEGCSDAAGYLSPGIPSAGNQPPFSWPTCPKNVVITNNIFQGLGLNTHPSRTCPDGSNPKGMLVRDSISTSDFDISNNSIRDENGQVIPNEPNWCFWVETNPAALCTN